MTRSLSNLIKYQFVDLDPYDTVKINNNDKKDNFIPLGKDGGISIETISQQEAEKAILSLQKKENNEAEPENISEEEYEKTKESRKKKQSRKPDRTDRSYRNLYHTSVYIVSLSDPSWVYRYPYGKNKYFLYSYRKLSVSYVYLLSDKRITYRKEILGQQVCVRFFCVGISGYGSYFVAL